ncbi:hypothetical protein [Streptomyces sp. NPDC001165]|uniref:hypothetical protein n=1 Tax=Streptomyces sp. NPDC001165 TaxID=3364546 RepID=UPI0036C959B6
MTATVVPAAPVRINADLIQRTYSTVLGEPRIGRPDLGSEEQRAHLAGLLRGQLRQLLQGIEGKVPGMRGETRKTTEYVITRVREALKVAFAEARNPDHLFDLALLTRSLLTLYGLSGLSGPLSRTQRAGFANSVPSGKR